MFSEDTSAETLRPTYAEVDLSQLASNLNAIHRKVTPARVMPVVKANAYGHGLVQVARFLTTQGAERLAVGIVEEGIVLRQAGVSVPILVMGGLLPSQVETCLRHDLTLTISSLQNLEDVDASARRLGLRASVHIKVDTGMGRLGVPYDRAEALLEGSVKCSHLLVEGIYSHFANSEAGDLTYARLQLNRFQGVLKFYEKRGLPMPLRHMANSGAILQLPGSYFDFVRPGIMLYGYYPSKEVQHSVEVRPALTWKTRAVYSKILPANHPVSYGSTWQTDHPVRILTLPVGYGDGYFRLLSNRGQVLVRRKRYPIVGRVCMDQILVNLEDDPAEVGEEVILLGNSGGGSVTADDLADLVGTIPYEVLTNINVRVPRVYFESSTLDYG